MTFAMGGGPHAGPRQSSPSPPAPNPSQHQSLAAAAAAKSLQSCPTLCDPIDGSPSGSPVPGILQARTLEWVVIPFSEGRVWSGLSGVNVPGFWVTFQHDGSIGRSKDNLVLV